MALRAREGLLEVTLAHRRSPSADPTRPTPRPASPTARSERWTGATRHPAGTWTPDLFFPIGTTGIAIEQVDAAKRICASCLVREPCLEFALASNQDAGVWGGLTEDERRTLKRARQRRRRLVS